MIDLRKAGPNDSLEEDIVATQIALSLQMAECGQAKEATQLIETAIAESQLRVRKNPKLAASQRRLAITMQTRANVGFALGDRKRACEDTDKARAQWKTLERLGGILEYDQDDSGEVATLAKLLKKCGSTQGIS